MEFLKVVSVVRFVGGLGLCWFVVLGSLVQSGFSSKFGKTETVTGPPSLEILRKLDWTFRDWSTAVFCSFLQLKDQFKTGL